MTEDQITKMVDRFLTWRLPEDFRPDAGISFKAEFNEHTAHPMKHEPTGTNLFTATQATEMVRHMVAEAEVDASTREYTPVTSIRELVNELGQNIKISAREMAGRHIKITIEGPNLVRELVLSNREFEQLRFALVDYNMTSNLTRVDLMDSDYARDVMKIVPVATLELTEIHFRLLKRGSTSKWIGLSDNAGIHDGEVCALGELERAGLVRVTEDKLPPGPPCMLPREITDAGRAALAKSEG